MNEKIKQLTRQALDECKSDDIEMIHAYMMDKYGIVEIPQCFSEKFAELIVAEMLQTCEDHPAWTGRMISEEIKQRFGVEE